MSSDQSQFEWQVMRHVPAAYNLARWIVRNDADAEDVVQDSVVKAYKAFAGFTGADAKPWLFKIVRNTCIRKLEQRNRAPVEMPDDSDGYALVAHEGDPEALALQNATAETVRKAVEELPDIFREIVVLREFEQMSYSEISDVIGCPMGTVMSRLARARSLLAASLREACL